MKQKPEGAGVCPHCGFDPDKYEKSVIYTLPLMTILHGRYLVGKSLGAGGFGITYIGYDLTLQMPVAIKEFYMRSNMFRDSTMTTVVTMTSQNTSDIQLMESNYRRFREEALTLARLNDLPGIVHVYDTFEENNTLYIVMSHLPGPTLKDYVKQRGGKLSWDETIKLVTPVIQSLGKLHELDLLHRDISPDNMMFGRDRKLCLIDFGGAKQSYLEHGDQRSSIALMKPGYSPVEQMSSEGIQGPWTDEYAMAATIYYCLCGQAPVDALSRVTGKEYVSVRKRNTSVTADQDAVLAKALSIQPGDRYPSMEAMLAALQNPAKAENATKPGKTAKQAKITKPVTPATSGKSEKVAKSAPTADPATQNAKKNPFKLIPVVLCLIAVVGIGAYFALLRHTDGGPLGTKARVGDVVTFGVYEQDNNKENGKEPIDWKVLAVEDGKALLLSENGLLEEAYNSKSVRITWEEATIRKWLNNSFPSLAFDDSERARIQTTTLEMDTNEAYNKQGGNSTTDKVFLLSASEVSRYLPTEKERVCGLASDTSADNSVQWWTRTPGWNNNNATLVDENGHLNYLGASVAIDLYYVRPAMWVSLE